MRLSIILFDIVLAIPLFFLLNYFDSDKKSDTVEINITHIILPLIYMVVISAILSSFGWNHLTENIFLIPIFEMIYRIIYINRILNRESLINHKYYYMIDIITIILSYILYNGFISKVDTVLPSATEFRGEIWFLIIIFLYISLKDRIHVNFIKEDKVSIENKKEYIVMNYAKLKNKYYLTEEESFHSLLYAMMVYENYKTPYMIRKVKEYTSKFLAKETKYGIMQISSKVFITDEESIDLCQKKLKKIISKLEKTKNTKIDNKKVLTEYYHDSEIEKEVLTILDIIIKFNK